MELCAKYKIHNTATLTSDSANKEVQYMSFYSMYVNVWLQLSVPLWLKIQLKNIIQIHSFIDFW